MASLLVSASGSKSSQFNEFVVTTLDGNPVSSVVAATLKNSEEAAEIIQDKRKFVPEELTIKVGSKVAFINKDQVSHNVYCRSPEFKFNVGAQEPGDRSIVEFTKSGKFLIRCAVHMDMKMVVIVE